MSDTYEPRRLARFSNSQTFVVRSFNDAGHGSCFIADWFRRHSHELLNVKAELAAYGIEVEGKKMGEEVVAVSLADELRKIKDETCEVLMACCVHLYTRDTFLYRLINQTLRDNDWSKLETLGPFCWFLHNLPFCEPFASQLVIGRLYRGAMLDDSMINSYKQAIGTIKAWNGFSSTSKDQSVAHMFGTNALFIIDINPDSRPNHMIDISLYSQYPDEQEVLIRAGRNFRVDSVEWDIESKKFLINLTII